MIEHGSSEGSNPFYFNCLDYQLMSEPLSSASSMQDYCEIFGVILVRIRKEGGETISVVFRGVTGF